MVSLISNMLLQWIGPHMLTTQKKWPPISYDPLKITMAAKSESFKGQNCHNFMVLEQPVTWQQAHQKRTIQRWQFLSSGKDIWKYLKIRMFIF